MVNGFLAEQIDFEEMQENGIIADHFPLHKRKVIEKLQESMDHYYSKLKQGFLVGTWEKYL